MVKHDASKPEDDDDEDATKIEVSTNPFGSRVRLGGFPPWAVVAISVAAIFAYAVIRIVELLK